MNPEVTKVQQIIDLSKKKPSDSSNKEKIKALYQELNDEQRKDLDIKMKTLGIDTRNSLISLVEDINSNEAVDRKLFINEQISLDSLKEDFTQKIKELDVLLSDTLLSSQELLYINKEEIKILLLQAKNIEKIDPQFKEIYTDFVESIVKIKRSYDKQLKQNVGGIKRDKNLDSFFTEVTNLVLDGAGNLYYSDIKNVAEKVQRRLDLQLDGKTLDEKLSLYKKQSQDNLKLIILDNIYKTEIEEKNHILSIENGKWKVDNEDAPDYIKKVFATVGSLEMKQFFVSRTLDSLGFEGNAPSSSKVFDTLVAKYSINDNGNFPYNFTDLDKRTGRLDEINSKISSKIASNQGNIEALRELYYLKSLVNNPDTFLPEDMNSAMNVSNRVSFINQNIISGTPISNIVEKEPKGWKEALINGKTKNIVILGTAVAFLFGMFNTEKFKPGPFGRIALLIVGLLGYDAIMSDAKAAGHGDGTLGSLLKKVSNDEEVPGTIKPQEIPSMYQGVYNSMFELNKQRITTGGKPALLEDEYKDIFLQLANKSDSFKDKTTDELYQFVNGQIQLNDLIDDKNRPKNKKGDFYSSASLKIILKDLLLQQEEGDQKISDLFTFNGGERVYKVSGDGPSVLGTIPGINNPKQNGPKNSPQVDGINNPKQNGPNKPAGQIPRTKDATKPGPSDIAPDVPNTVEQPGTFQTIAYVEDGAMYIIGSNGEPKLVTYSELSVEYKELFEKQAQLQNKINNFIFLLDSLVNYDSEYNKFNEKLTKILSLEGKDLSDMVGLTMTIEIGLNDLFEEVKKDKRPSEIGMFSSDAEIDEINLDDRISVYNYIRDELEDYKRVGSDIARLYFSKTGMTQEELESLIDEGKTPNSLKNILDDKEIKKLHKNISKKEKEAKDYFTDNKKEILANYPSGTDSSVVREMVISSFVEGYTKSLILEEYIEKQGDKDDKNLELFGDIKGIGWLDWADKTWDFSSGVLEMIAIELAAIAAGAVTLGVGTWAVNTLVYSKRTIKGLNYLRDLHRVGRIPLAQAGARNGVLVGGKTAILSSRISHLTLSTMGAGTAFHTGYWGAKNILGESTDFSDGWAESVAYMGAFRFMQYLQNTGKLGKWFKLDKNKSLLEQKGILVNQLALDSSLYAGFDLYGQGVLLEPGKWSLETLLQAFAMALMFKGVGSLKFKLEGGKVIVGKVTSPKNPPSSGVKNPSNGPKSSVGEMPSGKSFKMTLEGKKYKISIGEDGSISSIKILSNGLIHKVKKENLESVFQSLFGGKNLNIYKTKNGHIVTELDGKLYTVNGRPSQAKRENLTKVYSSSGEKTSSNTGKTENKETKKEKNKTTEDLKSEEFVKSANETFDKLIGSFLSGLKQGRELTFGGISIKRTSKLGAKEWTVKNGSETLAYTNKKELVKYLNENIDKEILISNRLRSVKGLDTLKVKGDILLGDKKVRVRKKDGEYILQQELNNGTYKDISVSSLSQSEQLALIDKIGNKKLFKQVEAEIDTVLSKNMGDVFSSGFWGEVEGSLKSNGIQGNMLKESLFKLKNWTVGSFARDVGLGLSKPGFKKIAILKAFLPDANKYGIFGHIAFPLLFSNNESNIGYNYLTYRVFGITGLVGKELLNSSGFVDTLVDKMDLLKFKNN